MKTMRFVTFLFVLIVACAFGDEDERKPMEIIPILSSQSMMDPIDGKFEYSYESGDGTKAMQRGQLVNIDPEHAGQVVEGEYSYQGYQSLGYLPVLSYPVYIYACSRWNPDHQAPDGHSYTVKYIADENGYQPYGEHLPVAPEVPPVIARALAYLATLPPPKDNIENLNH